MKLQPDRLEGVNTITRHVPGEVHVGAVRFDRSLVVPWKGEPRLWAPARLDVLEAAHFDEILALAPELVIFGSGHRMRFPPAATLAALIGRRIGVESMDTAAACRTYNVLVSEGRKVVAALIIEPAG